MAVTGNRIITYSGLDLGKLIAAILVVLLHTHPFTEGTTADYWFSCLCRIAVPFFFITSSFLFYKRKGDIKKYIFRILILYAVWFFLELPLTIHRFFIDTDKPFAYNLLLFIRGLLLNSTFHASWYLTASWQGMLIVWWLSRKMKGTPLWILGLLCFISALPGTIWYGLISGTPVRPYYWSFNMLLCPANSFIIAIPYCILGKYLAENQLRFSREASFGLLALAFLFSVLEIWTCRNSYWMSDVFLGLLFICPLLVWLMANTTLGIPYGTSKCLRSVSTLVFLSHLPIRDFVSSSPAFSEGWPLAVSTLTISVLFSIAIYFLSLRIQVLRYLY